MGDFAYDNLGICYWNGTMGPFNVGVVGSGSALNILVDIIYNEAFREFLPEMKLCRELFRRDGCLLERGVLPGIRDLGRDGREAS